MSQKGVIYEAALKCQTSFRTCQRVEALSDRDWAENRLADFNLWASGIGALAYKRASLDARLALRPNVRDTIANLLLVLNAAVQECLEQGKLLRKYTLCYQ